MAVSYRKSAVDTIFIGLASLVQFLVGLFVMPLITKFLNTQSYGIWSQVNVTISLIIPITSLGLGGAVVRFLVGEKSREEIQEGFYSVIVVLFAVNAVAGGILVLFASPLAANFFDDAIQVVRLVGLSVILISLTENYLLLIRAFQQVKTVSIFMMAEICLLTGSIAFLVVGGQGILSIILAFVSIKALKFIALFFMVKSQIGFRWPRFTRLREFLRFGLPLVPGGIGLWLVNLSDRYVIGFFLGAGSVGVYSAAYNLGSIPYSVMAVLTYVLMATLPQLYDEGRMDEVKTHLRYTMKYFLAIAIPFLFGATILGRPILRLFSNPDIAEGGYLVVPVIALAVVFLCVYSIIFHILLVVKKPKIAMPLWITAAVLNIGLNIILVPRIGIIGAALTTLLAYTLGLGAVSYYAFKEFTFPVDWRFVFKSLAASVAMSAVIWWIYPHSMMATFFTVIIGVAVYGVVIMLLRGFSQEELRFFKGLLRRESA